MLSVGTKAPEFELNSTPDQKLKLSELLGKNIIVAFYPADWSPVCSDQMALYNEMLKLFTKHNAQLLGISVGFALIGLVYLMVHIATRNSLLLTPPFGGPERIRTAVQGFADLCLATRPQDLIKKGSQR